MDLRQELNDYIKKYKNIKLSDAIYNILLSAILIGNFSPNTKINMLNLSNIFGVSISPVKNAILKLQDIGLLEFNQNKGAFITIFDKQDYLDMFYYRMTLEALAASQATALMSDEDFAQLLLLIEKLKSVSGEHGILQSNFPVLPMEVSRADIEFHSFVVEHSKNLYLIKQYKKLYPKIYFSHQFVTVFKNLNYIDEHYCLAYSILSKDPEVAGNAFLHHSRIGLYFYEKNIK